ncbi:MAG: TniQ family protein [Micromonosporaceae bacterium]|nr:TniQ family protein [Micromonosporaceae bacterium]
MTPGPGLPRSLAPLPDESITGYVLRLAHRLDTSPARLLVVTGLHESPRTTPSRRLLTQPEPAALRNFAHATHLSPAEVADLFPSTFASRYPPATPRPDPAGRHGSRTHLERWQLTTSTRYCPQCLIGDRTTIQRRHGGPWQRTWCLPVVFTCPHHRRYLLHQCPTCGSLVHQRDHGHLPRWWDSGLHPTQCRARPSQQSTNDEAGRHGACGAWLTDARPGQRPCSTVSATQQRILAALDSAGPDQVHCLGQSTTPARYFTDLILLSYLIRRSWPLARDLTPSPAVADALDTYLTQPQETTRRRRVMTASDHHPRTEHRAPPLDAVACAALLTTADGLLTLETPRTLTPHLRHLLGHDQRRLGRQSWARQFVTVRPDCSEGLRHAFAPILQTYARPGRGRGLGAAIRRVPFGPEHIPQFLQDDWYQQYLAHFDGINTAQLRRTAALHLCQTAMGGSVREAAGRLGLPDTRTAYYRSYSSISAVHAWARRRSDPHEFEAAVHDIADQIEAMPQPIDYHRRRTALRDWCIDSASWTTIIDQLPGNGRGHQPELGDRQQDCASIIVWSRVTGTERAYAPHPIRDQQPTDVAEQWRQRAHKTFAHIRDDTALQQLLTAYAQWLIHAIDTTGATPPGPWTATHPRSSGSIATNNPDSRRSHQP